MKRTEVYTEKMESRFLNKVARSDSCWMWTASKNLGGYGQVWDPAMRTYRHAHQMAYEMWIGPISSGLEIDHLCRVRGCVNPNHLEPVTKAENIRRGESPPAINGRKTRCIRGHPLSGDNVYERSNGGRQCRRCQYLRNKRRREALAHASRNYIHPHRGRVNARNREILNANVASLDEHRKKKSASVG